MMIGSIEDDVGGVAIRPGFIEKFGNGCNVMLAIDLAEDGLSALKPFFTNVG